MLWLIVIAVSAGGVILAALRVAHGTWSMRDLTEPLTSTPGPLPLPAPPAAVSRADLVAIRFDRALRGYDPTIVDDRLEEIADALDPTVADDDRNATSIGLASVVDVAAEPIPVRALGYRMDQVDAVLDRWTRPGVVDLMPAPSDLPPPPPDLQPMVPAADPWVGAEVDTRTEPELTPRGDDVPRPGPLTWRATMVAFVLYASAAAFVLRRLIADPAGGYLSQGVQDQQAFEWYFGATAHNLASLSNPLFTTLQNYPDGVNLMSNAAVMGLGAPLAPLTWVAGPHVTFLLIEWLGFTLTAFAWYLLFVRRLLAAPWTAMIGGALCGFSPAMVSHGNGHPNFLAQFLVPVLIDRILALQQSPQRWRPIGLTVGLLAAWQLWMGEEVLLLAAVGIGVLALVLALHGRLPWRALLPGIALSLGVGIAVFAIPLWWQFFGPQSYREIWSPPGGNDLAALWGRATRTVGADPWASAALSMNRTEENAFFGIPLWFVAVAAVILLWRRPLVRAMAVVIVVSCWLSLGPQVLLHGQPIAVPAPWRLFDTAPLVGNVLPSRFSMVAVPAFAVLLVLLLEWARERMRRRPMSLPAAAAAGAAAVAVGVALLPVVPTSLVVDPRPPTPALFTGGGWTDLVDDGSILAIPPPDISDLRAGDWQAAARYDFPLVEGYFLGPDASGSGQGQRGATRRPLSQWLAEIAQTDQARQATSDDRQVFIDDVRAWRTDALVLPQGRDDEAVLLSSLTSVFGAPVAREGAWVWDVRNLRAPG